MKTKDIEKIYFQPLIELLHQAHEVHRKHHKATQVQLSNLLSIKTGGCSEDCSYCPQAARYHTDIENHPLLEVDTVVKRAREAKASGSTRFCMGAAWREVKDGDEFDRVLEMVRRIDQLGMETCCTLGMITEEQALKLKEAGLHAYNHNIDTSEEFYHNVISTRTYEDRIRTIENIRKAGITVCTGGILGMGEGDTDRISFLKRLATFEPHPESVTINALVRIKGTPLQDEKPISPLVLMRVIATARILMPLSMIRLSAGRLSLSQEGQLMCFFAGANSIFAGEKLLTSPNPEFESDEAMFSNLGLTPMQL